MSEWRPEGWVQPNGIGDETPPMAYEAGADAIVAALKETALYANNPEFMRCKSGVTAVYCLEMTKHQHGHLIFIPDTPERQLPDRCDSCPPLKMGWSGGKKYCGVCGWLIEESRGMPNSEARKRIENG